MELESQVMSSCGRKCAEGLQGSLGGRGGTAGPGKGGHSFSSREEGGVPGESEEGPAVA